MTGDDFLHRLTVLYGSPDTIDADAFAAEYRAVLRGADPRLVALAFDHLRDTRLWRNWPTPGEVKAAITAVAARCSAHVPPEHQKFEALGAPTLTPDEIAKQEAIKRRVAVMVADLKAMLTGGDRRAAEGLGLSWMDGAEFEARMAEIPDREPRKGAK